MWVSPNATHSVSWSYKLLVLVCIAVLSGCGHLVTSLAPKTPPTFATAGNLDLSRAYDKTEFDRWYLSFYRIGSTLDQSKVEYFHGMIKIADMGVGDRLRGQAFIPTKPKRPKGTVFILHGYFDHVGSVNNLVNYALSQGYAVFAYDLPGHGFSSGPSGVTGDISHNANLLKSVVHQYRDSLPKPFHLIGFSTGGSITLEYARLNGNSQFNNVIAVSPLVRHAHWHWGKTGYTLARWFTSGIKRRDKRNSRNQEYLAFAKQDPLRGQRVSFRFLKSIYKWVKGFEAGGKVESRVLLIQGDEDQVVDWEYNLPMLASKFSRLQIHKVQKGKHQLFNDANSVQEETFKQIFRFIE